MNIKKIKPAENAYNSPLLIKNLFDYSIVLNPENEIVYRDISRYNYYGFQKRVKKYANMLKNLGLKGGETVAIMDYDSHRFLEAYFAIPMTGNVLHTINWRLSPEQIHYTINHAEDLVIITHEDFLPVLEGFSADMPSVKHLIVCREQSSKVSSQFLDIYGYFEDLMDEASDEYDFQEFDEDAVATLFYTTGTTGNPKGVYFTHRQLVLHTYNLASTLGFVGSISCKMDSNDVYLPLTPMFHVHAWGFPFVATAFSLKQVYIGKFSPEVLIGMFLKEKPTISHCVPTVLQMILNNEKSKDVDLNGWKVIIGGAALTKSLAVQALERGIDVVVGYGMSETCPIIGFTYLDKKFKDKDFETQAEERIRTGIPPFLVNVKIVNEEGKEVAKDDKEQGEILVRAPWLTQGYYKEQARGEELWEGGYLHTGDVATVNKNNSMKIKDRIKDVIKSGGEWISSVQLENIIHNHKSVEEVAVIGVPDEKWSERPYALVKLKAGEKATSQDIKDYLEHYVITDLLSKWAVPQDIEFTDEIPKTSVGKIDKKEIRKRLNII